MRPARDWSLYLVTDRDLAGGRPLLDVVAAAVRGGVTAVQLREKTCSTREFVELGRALQPMLSEATVPLIINDRVDVAMAIGAEGVHLGQSDMDAVTARSLLGADAIIGLSVETMDQALAAESLDVDYLGVGPIFATPTKADAAAPWGLAQLAKLRAASRHILVAIGGIGTDNAAGVRQAGADGIAVVSAICAAPDVERATRELSMSVCPRG